MAQALLPEDLWSLIAVHFPARPPSSKSGRLRIDGRAILIGILFVLKTGMPWDSIDAASLPAPAGGKHTGRNPTDQGKLGCKHQLLVEQRGLPRGARLSGRADS